MSFLPKSGRPYFQAYELPAGALGQFAVEGVGCDIPFFLVHAGIQPEAIIDRQPDVLPGKPGPSVGQDGSVTVEDIQNHTQFAPREFTPHLGKRHAVQSGELLQDPGRTSVERGKHPLVKLSGSLPDFGGDGAGFGRFLFHVFPFCPDFPPGSGAELISTVRVRQARRGCSDDVFSGWNGDIGVPESVIRGAVDDLCRLLNPDLRAGAEHRQLEPVMSGAGILVGKIGIRQGISVRRLEQKISLLDYAFFGADPQFSEALPDGIGCGFHPPTGRGRSVGVDMAVVALENCEAKRLGAGGFAVNPVPAIDLAAHKHLRAVVGSGDSAAFRGDGRFFLVAHRIVGCDFDVPVGLVDVERRKPIFCLVPVPAGGNGFRSDFVGQPVDYPVQFRLELRGGPGFADDSAFRLDLLDQIGFYRYFLHVNLLSLLKGVGVSPLSGCVREGLFIVLIIFYTMSKWLSRKIFNKMKNLCVMKSIT